MEPVAKDLFLTSERQEALEALGIPIEADRFVLDTDTSLFAVSGVLMKIQGDRQVIAYASLSLRQSQRRYCTTHREMLAAVTMYFRSYLRGAQFTLRTDHRSLWWLQKFHNSDGMLARWYMLLGQFSVTFEYTDGLSRQCGECLQPNCPVVTPEVEPQISVFVACVFAAAVPIMSGLSGAGMGIAGGEFSMPRMVPECAGLPTIGEPADDTFTRIDQRGW